MNQERLEKLAKTFISDKAFEGLLDAEIKQVKDLVIGIEALQPHLLIAEMKGTDGYFPLTLVAFKEFGLDRHEILYHVGEDAAEKEMQPICVILATEVWIRLPEKQEGVIIAGKTIDGRMKAVLLNIERNPDKTIKQLVEVENTEITEAEILDAFFRGFVVARVDGILTDKDEYHGKH